MLTDPYLSAVLRLAGHKGFQAFETFCVLVARHRWPGSTVHRTTDRDSLFDILVTNPDDPSQVTAQIECKALAEREVTTKKNLTRVVKKWDVCTLQERIHKIPLSKTGEPETILATTVPVKRGLWDKYRADLRLPKVQLWSAHELAGFLTKDSQLATFCDPNLPNADKFLNEVSLELIVESEQGGKIGVLNLRDVIADARRVPPLELKGSTLLFGPPNVGKTCFAVQQGSQWIKHKGSRKGFIFNPRKHSPDDIRLIRRHVEGGDVVIIVDDIHFAPDPTAWARAVAEIAELPRTKAKVFWVSRDDSLAPILRFAPLPSPTCIRFPVEKVLALFTERLTGYSEWQRLVCALESRLSPQFANLLKTREPAERDVSDADPESSFRDWAGETAQEHIRKRLAEIEERTGSAYPLYTMLLPFGSIGMAVPISFLTFLGLSTIPEIESLTKQGLATRSGKFVALSEHPFQVRQILQVCGPELLCNPLRDTLSSRCEDSPPPSLSAAVFGVYLTHFVKATETRGELKRLANYAEWSGVREQLAACLKFLLDEVWTSVDDLRHDAMLWYLKLSRVSYPTIESNYTAMLQNAEAFWSARLDEAKTSRDRKAAGCRVDTILYELAYIAYVQENYDRAAEWFALSVDSGLELIRSAMVAGPGSSGWPDAEGALSNIWVSAILEHGASVRSILKRFVNGESVAEDRKTLESRITDVARIHKALLEANRTEAQVSGDMYLLALRVLRSSWQPPTAAAAIARDPRMEAALGRHERNAWLHALQYRCWPVLYGLVTDPITTEVPAPGGTYSPSFGPRTPAGDRPFYEMRHIEVLLKWAKQPTDKSVGREALITAALTLGGGGFEYLGDLFLLALKASDSSEVRKTIKWYLLNALPTVGFNGLPKAAAHGI